MQKYFIWNILYVTFCFQYVENANILAIFPIPVKSHFVMSKRIVESLASRGHNIDLYTSFPEEKRIDGINHIQIPDVPILTTPHSVTDLRSISMPGIMELMFTAPEVGGNDLCENILQTKIMKTLRDARKHYDLLLVELFVVDCFFGYAEVFNTPIVALTSSVDLPWGAHRIGNLDNPAYIPTYFGHFKEKMTIYQRILNAATLIYAKYRHQTYLANQDKVTKDFFGKDLPSLNDIVSNTSLILVNSHFSLNQPRPKVPNFIEIAGLHIDEPKPLRKDLSDVIGDSKFIYFSFGSIASSETLTLEKLQHICDIFKELKHTVLWKADRNNLPNELSVPENVYTEPWLPQLDILCHPNILFFITHSGLMGSQEAVYCGVPMLSVPMFADQFLNTKNFENKGLSLSLEIETATRNQIYQSMKELIENPKYRENAKKLSAQFKDRPRTPLEEAAYWIEYVIRYKGAPQLRSRAADLAWYQYYLIDVGLIVISVVVIIVSVIYKILKYILTYSIVRNKKHKML